MQEGLLLDKYICLLDTAILILKFWLIRLSACIII